jgi:hypothetical protein
LVTCSRYILSTNNRTAVSVDPNNRPKVPSPKVTAKIPPILLARIRIAPTDRSITPVENKKQKHHAIKIEVTEFVKMEERFDAVSIFPDVTTLSIIKGIMIIKASSILPINNFLPALFLTAS